MPRKAKKGGGASSEDEEGEELPLRRHRAKQQQEVNRKREELLTVFLTVKVQREEQNSRVNQAKLNQVWRRILRQARSEQLRDDIVILRQTFERQLDGLDDVIKSLSGDLEEAERQCCRVRRLHLGHVERLRTLLDERVAFVRCRWEEILQDVSRGFAEDSDNMASHSRRQRQHVEDAAFALSRRHGDVMRRLHAAYADIAAARRHAQRDRVATLRCADEEKLEEKRRQKREEEEEVEQACRPAQLLMSRNRKLIDDADKDAARVRRLQAAVADLRVKLSAFQTETATEADALTAASGDVTVKTRRLRADLVEARRACRQRLAVLALRTDTAARKLRAVVAEGEKVLHVATLCGKIRQVANCWPHGGDDERWLGVTQPSKTFPEVDALTRRLNRALLQQDALGQRAVELRLENQQLRLALRRRLDGMTLGGGPALLTVKTAPSADVRDLGPSCHNVIEANDVVRNSLS
ncbi:dynein regulatory complex subunit 2-like isoform X2 [Festucalex cinctus]